MSNWDHYFCLLQLRLGQGWGSDWPKIKNILVCYIFLWFRFYNLVKQWLDVTYFEDTSLHDTSVARSNKYGHMIWNFHLTNLLSCSFSHGENVNSECLTMQVSGLCQHKAISNNKKIYPSFSKVSETPTPPPTRNLSFTLKRSQTYFLLICQYALEKSKTPDPDF